MHIYNDIPDDIDYKTALCIGKFDGFHIGHRLLMEEGLNTSYPLSVFTFIFKGNKTIDSIEEKRNIARSIGVINYIEIPANDSFFSIKPDEFIRDIVCEKLHAGCVIVGSDFRFGCERSGDIQTLKEYSDKYGYDLIVKDKLTYEDREISSSYIRELIAKGDMEMVTKLLRRPYIIEGVVHDGNHIGRTIGVPTANITPSPDKHLPPYGVYAVTVHTEDIDKPINGIANLGTKPTIGEDNPVGLEVNLFDYKGDLYGKKIQVKLHSFIRHERDFESIDKLHAQIDKDISESKKILHI